MDPTSVNPTPTAPPCLELRVRSLEIFGPDPGAHGPEQFLLRLESPGWDWRPGQFVMVRAEGFGLELVWGRPLSIALEDDHGLALLVQRVGRGTGHLARLAPGQRLTVWGPLGNGFPEPQGQRPTLLLAGGVGLAPFLGYAARHPQPERLRLILGHRLALARFPMPLLHPAVRLTTFHDQGPQDLARFVALLDQQMAALETGGMVLACGPSPFLATVQRLALAAGVEAHLSLESRMACGLGACLGCVTRDPTGHHVQVCTHGPVFRADRVNLERE